VLDKNVGDALLKLDLTPRTEAPSSQVDRIIDADRRRVQRWTRTAVALWILAALGAISIFFMGCVMFPIVSKLIDEEKQAKRVVEVVGPGKEVKVPAGDTTEKAAREVTLRNPNAALQVLAKITAMCVVLGSASFMVLVFAGLATVLLLLRSRTATFRQIPREADQFSCATAFDNELPGLCRQWHRMRQGQSQLTAATNRRALRQP
jgi:hypothetical protein